MKAKSRLTMTFLAAAVVGGSIAPPQAQGRTIDNRDVMAGNFTEFALFGGNFVDPEDELNKVRIYLAVQRGALHIGYQGTAPTNIVPPLGDVDALMLWCPMRDELDQCTRRTPIVTAFSVSDNGDATFSGHDPEFGEMSFAWTQGGPGFNGTFKRCISEVFIGEGWYIEWDISLHGPTQAGWTTTLSGRVGSLRSGLMICGPTTMRDKVGKVELAWSNDGRTI